MQLDERMSQGSLSSRIGQLILKWDRTNHAAMQAMFPMETTLLVLNKIAQSLEQHFVQLLVSYPTIW